MYQFGGRFRFVISAVTFCLLISLFSNYSIINFTLICMKKDDDNITLSDGTIRQRFDYSNEEKSLIMMTVAFGTILGTFPLNWILTRVGARRTFTTTGLISAAATALMPLAAERAFVGMLALRVIQGVAYAACFGTIGLVTVEWAPLRETSFWLGFLTVFAIGSSSISNPVTAAICESGLGWRASFYVHAAAGAILSVLWFLIYRDSPANHVAVGERELRVIHKNKSAEHIAGGKKDVPYWAICKSPVILVIWLNSFVELTVSIFLITYTPTYLYNVLGYDVSTTGVLVSVISFSQLPPKIGFCLSSDRWRFTSERGKIIIFNSVAFAIQGVCMCLAAFIRLPWLAVVLCCACSITGSANCGGFYKCASYHARQHAHFVVSMIQFSKCLALFAAPALVSVFVKEDDDEGGWRIVFLILGALLILVNFAFCYVATDKPAAFTLSEADARLAEEEKTNAARAATDSFSSSSSSTEPPLSPEGEVPGCSIKNMRL